MEIKKEEGVLKKPAGQSARGISYLAVLAVLIMGVYQAEANVDEIKVYKNAFPGSKPQCIFCHIEKIPKKDAGLHDLNAYGTKVKSTDPEITEETFKKVGAFEDFKEEGVPAADGETQTEPACDPADAECGK